VEKLLQAAEKNRLGLLSQEFRQRGFEKKYGMILGPAGISRNQIILCVSFKGQMRAIQEISQIAFKGDSIPGFKTNLEEALG
jgi:hypothetical protein